MKEMLITAICLIGMLIAASVVIRFERLSSGNIGKRDVVFWSVIVFIMVYYGLDDYIWSLS